MAGKKGRRGWGRIRRLPSNQHQASYIGPDRVRHNAPKTFAAKMDAEGWLASERRLIELDIWTPPAWRAAEKVAKAVTVGEYAATWIEQRNVKPRTKIFYRGLLDNHIAPKLGQIPLKSLTADAVRAWYSTLGTDHATRNGHAYGLLHAVCATAVADEVMLTNPATMTRTNPPTKRKPVILSVPEVARLADAMPERLKALVLISAWCGLRWGEVIELRGKDIDDNCEVIYVSRAVTHRGGCRVDTPKSGKGRAVVIPPHIRADLKHHLEVHVAKDPEALLFPAVRGCHLNDNVFRQSFNLALASIGRDNVRIHDLRHFSGTQTARVGNLVETMGRLGHSTPKASLTYQQIVSGRDAEVAEALSELAKGQR